MRAKGTGGPALFTRPFVLVALGNLAFNLAAAFAIHLPGFLHELGAGEAEIGRILAANPVAALLLGPAVGRALDRYGRRLAIRLGSVLHALAISAYLAIDAISPFVYAVRLVEGTSHTLLYAALFTYAADLVPAARRTEGLAVFGASGLVPLGLSGQLGDVLVAASGYRAMYATALGFALLALLLCWPLRDVLPAAAREPAADESSTWWRPFVQRELVPIWCVAFAFFFAMSAVQSFLKTYVLAHDRGTTGGFFMAYALVALLLRVFLGWLPDRVGLRRMVLPAIAAYAGCALALAFARSGAHVLMAGMLGGVGHGYTYPVLFSLVVTRAREHERGTAMGAYTTIDWGGMLAAGPIAGELIERQGYTAAYVMVAAALALGAALFYALDRPSPRAAAHAS